MNIKSNIKDINNIYIQDNHIIGIEVISGMAKKVVAIVYVIDNIFYTKFIDSRAADLGVDDYRDRLGMWKDNNVAMEILGSYKVDVDGIIFEYNKAD